MKRETIVFTDRDTMKQSEEISPQGYSHGDNNLDLSWARRDARPNGEDRDQPQVLEFSEKRGLGSFRGVIMKLLSRSEFLVYSLLIGLLAFGDLGHWRLLRAGSGAVLPLLRGWTGAHVPDHRHLGGQEPGLCGL